MTNTSSQRQTYPTGIIWLPFIVLGLIYLPTLYDLVLNWYQDDNYSHGFLIPLVSTYLIWNARRDLAVLPRSHNNHGLALVVLGMVLFVLGTAAAEYFTARLSLVLTLFGLTWYAFGNEIVRKTWFAFFFLCFMIPVPYVFYYSVAFPMQVAATKITVGVLQFVGMAIVRQGNIIHLDGGYSLEVADACSGIRSLVALLALGAIYAYWSQKKLLPRLLLFFSTVPIAVFANVVRVLITTVLASVGLTEITEEPWHSGMGLLVFIISFICLFVIAALLRRIFR